MANTLRIKRRVTGAVGAPGALKTGELAWNMADAGGTGIVYGGYGDDGSGNATSVVALAGAKALTLNQLSGVSISSPSTNQVLAYNGSTWVNATSPGGTVTSVGLSLPAIFSVSGSPVTGSGTLSASLASQTANYVWAAPDGSAGAPVFRALAANDIPSLTAAKISDFNTAVRTNRLDQMAAPSADVAMNNYKITGLATPTQATDACTKGYADSLSTGLDVKASVRCATTANITLSGTQTIDGVTLIAGDRVLVKDQNTGSQNGIYVVAAGAWSRSTDADTDSEVTSGMFTFVEEGSTNGDTGWVLSTNNPITLNSTALVFAQFSNAGSFSAGAGLLRTGNTIDVVSANSARIVVNADNIDLATVSQSNTSGSDGINFVQSHTVDSYGRVSATVTANVRTGSTAQTGILQLTDSTSSTSTTTAATPNSVKTAYDLANAALPKAGGTMTGKITLVNAAAGGASANLGTGVADPSAPASGDFWNNGGTIKFYNGSATKTIAYLDSSISGTAANVTGTVGVGNGGTGFAGGYAIGDLLYASAASTLSKLAAVATGNVLISGGVATAPTWGKVGLSTHVSGTLTLANGGTGSDLSAAAAGTIFKTNGTVFVAATAGTDYLNDASTIDGGTF